MSAPVAFALGVFCGVFCGVLCGIIAAGWVAGYRRTQRMRQIDRALEEVRGDLQRRGETLLMRDAAVRAMPRRRGA